MTYLTLVSRQASERPRAWAATMTRVVSKKCMSSRKPCPSFPTRFAWGTRTSSRAISAVSLARIPSFPWILFRVTPFASAGTMIRLKLLCFFSSGFVMHWVTMKSQTVPLVMNILLPLIT